MRLRRLTLWVVLARSLFVTASVASAGPKENVATATMAWAETLGQNDPDKVVHLYATDGVLWGTLSPTVRAIEQRCATTSSRHSRSCPVSRSDSESN